MMMACGSFTAFCRPGRFFLEAMSICAPTHFRSLTLPSLEDDRVLSHWMKVDTKIRVSKVRLLAILVYPAKKFAKVVTVTDEIDFG